MCFNFFVEGGEIKKQKLKFPEKILTSPHFPATQFHTFTDCDSNLRQ